MQKTPANARVLKRNPHLRRDDKQKTPLKNEVFVKPGIFSVASRAKKRISTFIEIPKIQFFLRGE